MRDALRRQRSFKKKVPERASGLRPSNRLGGPGTAKVRSRRLSKALMIPGTRAGRFPTPPRRPEWASGAGVRYPRPSGCAPGGGRNPGSAPGSSPAGDRLAAAAPSAGLVRARARGGPLHRSGSARRAGPRPSHSRTTSSGQARLAIRDPRARADGSRAPDRADRRAARRCQARAAGRLVRPGRGRTSSSHPR